MSSPFRKELFILSAHISPITLWETATGAVIETGVRSKLPTDEGIIKIRIFENSLGKRDEIILILRHPKAEKDIIVTLQRVKKIRSGESESPVEREGFLELWPEGIVHLLFLLAEVEKFLAKKRRGYEPAMNKWAMNLLR